MAAFQVLLHQRRDAQHIAIRKRKAPGGAIAGIVAAKAVAVGPAGDALLQEKGAGGVPIGSAGGKAQGRGGQGHHQIQIARQAFAEGRERHAMGEAEAVAEQRPALALRQAQGQLKGSIGRAIGRRQPLGPGQRLGAAFQPQAAGQGGRAARLPGRGRDGRITLCPGSGREG